MAFASHVAGALTARLHSLLLRMYKICSSQGLHEILKATASNPTC